VGLLQSYHAERRHFKRLRVLLKLHNSYKRNAFNLIP